MNEITITLRWNAADETTIRFSEGYKNSYPLLQADMLKDAIGLLQSAYEERLEKGILSND